jgi:hypothetical protein
VDNRSGSVSDSKAYLQEGYEAIDVDGGGNLGAGQCPRMGHDEIETFPLLVSERAKRLSPSKSQAAPKSRAKAKAHAKVKPQAAPRHRAHKAKSTKLQSILAIRAKA